MSSNDNNNQQNLGDLSGSNRPEVTEITPEDAQAAAAPALETTPPASSVVPTTTSAQTVPPTQAAATSAAPARPAEWTIFVRTLTGKTVEIKVENLEDNPATASKVKEKVQEKEGIPPEQQTLIFGGKQLANDTPLTEYGVGDRKTLHLVLNLRGGAEL